MILSVEGFMSNSFVLFPVHQWMYRLTLPADSFSIAFNIRGDVFPKSVWLILRCDRIFFSI